MRPAFQKLSLMSNTLLPKANKQLQEHHHLDSAPVRKANCSKNVYINKAYKIHFIYAFN